MNTKQFPLRSQDPMTLNPDELRLVHNVKLAESLQVTHTPTFFVLNRKDGTLKTVVGPREFLEAYHGIPGVPTPEPKH